MDPATDLKPARYRASNLRYPMLSPVWIATHRARQQVTQREAAARRREDAALDQLAFFPPSGELCTRCTPRCNGTALSQVQVTLTSRGDSRRSVPFVGGDVVPRRDGARLWWWCYGRLCLAFLPRSTNRDDPPPSPQPRCSPLSGLSCPFLSLPFPPCLFLSLSLFLFPFFSSFHPALADDDGHGHGEFRVTVSRQRNTSSCYSSHTLQDVPYVRRDTSVCFCPATAKSRVSCVTLNYPLAVRLEDHRWESN